VSQRANTRIYGDGPLGPYFREIEEHQPLAYEEEAELARQIEEGDQGALKTLVEANLRFVVTIAKEYRNRGLPFEDLICEGNMGLLKAAKRFDKTRGCRFISYAVWWIRQTIREALAKQAKSVRLPLNKIGELHKIAAAVNRLEQRLGRTPSLEEIAHQMDVSMHWVMDRLCRSGAHLSLEAPLREAMPYP